MQLLPYLAGKCYAMRILTILFCCLQVISLAQTPCAFQTDTSRWATEFRAPGNGPNQARVVLGGDDNYIYFGGSYSAFGGDPDIGAVTRFDGEKYEQLGLGFQCVSCGTGRVESLAKDDQGNIYIAGFFHSAINYDGSIVESKNIVKWNVQTETFEALGKGLGYGEVSAMVWHNDTLYAGGEFDEAFNLTDTILVKRLAFYDFSTGRWNSFGHGAENGTGSAQVEDLIIDNNGHLIVGGSFTSIDSNSVNGVARWSRNNGWDNMSGGLISTSAGGPYPGIARALEVDLNTNTIYAVGEFGEYTGSASVHDERGFAKYNGASWVLLSGFGKPSGVNGWSFTDLEYVEQDTAMYITGNFKQYTPTNPQNNPVANSLAKLDLNTGTLSEFAGGLKGSNPNSIDYWQGKYWLAGYLPSIDSNGFDGLAMWDGATWDNLGNGLSNGVVHELACFNNRVYLMGDLDRVNGKHVKQLVKYEEGNGFTHLDFNLTGASASNYAKVIFTVEEIGQDLWVGGLFAGIDTFTTTSIAKVNRLTGEVSVFGSGLGGHVPRIYDIEEFQGDVIIAGTFTSVDGVPAGGLAKYSNGAWIGLGDFSGQVEVLENQGDSLLFVGGSYYSVNGDNNLKALVVYNGDSLSKIAGGFTGGRVRALHTDLNGILHIGGAFSNPKQADGNYLLGSYKLLQYIDGKLIDSTKLDINGDVHAITSDSLGIVYFGGNFSSLSGVDLNHLGAWHPNVGLITLGGGVTAKRSGVPIVGMGIANDKLYIGGDLRRVGNIQSSGIAEFKLLDSLPTRPSFAFADTVFACDSAFISSGISLYPVAWSTGEFGQGIWVDSTGWYIAEANSAFTCPIKDSVYVLVNQSPSLDHLTDSVSVCADSLIFNGPAGFHTYDWTNGDSTQTIGLGAGFHEINLLVTDSNGCSASHTYYFFIDPIPEFYLPTDTGFCGEGLLAPSVSAESFYWNTGDSTQYLAVDSAGLYILTATNSLGCAFTDSVFVNIYNDPLASIPDSIQACNSLTLDAGPEFISYYWTTGDTSQTINLGPGVHNILLSITDTNGCGNTQSIYAEVFSPPSVSFTGQDSLCGAGNLQVGPAYSSYLWSTGDTSNSITITQTGWYQVQVIDSNGCQVVDSVYRTIFQPMNNIFLSDTLAGCDSVLLFVPLGYNNLNWSTGDTGRSITVYNDSYIYLTATDSNGCSVLDDIEVLIEGLSPVAGFSYASAGSPYEFDFEANATHGQAIYNWSFGDGNVATGTTVSHSYSANQTYTVTLVVENECGIDSTSQAVTAQGVGMASLLKEQTRFFPNPGRDQLNLDLPAKANVSILNLQGARLRSYSLQKGVNTLTLSDLSSGTYLLQLVFPDGSSMHLKWIKQN